MSVLDDPKVSADVNTAKGICLELLGCIGARIQNLFMEAEPEQPQDSQETVKAEDTQEASSNTNIATVVREQDRKGLKSLAAAEEELIELLLSTQGKDYPEVLRVFGATLKTAEKFEQPSIDYLAARWSYELQSAMKLMVQLSESQEVSSKFQRELAKRNAAIWQTQPSNGFQSK